MDDNRTKLEAVLSQTLDAVVPEDQLYVDIAKVAADLYELRVSERKLDVEEAKIELEKQKLEAEMKAKAEERELEKRKLEVEAEDSEAEREVKVKTTRMDVVKMVCIEVGKTAIGAVLFGAGLGASFMFEKTYGKSISRTFQAMSRLIRF